MKKKILSLTTATLSVFLLVFGINHNSRIIENDKEIGLKYDTANFENNQIRSPFRRSGSYATFTIDFNQQSRYLVTFDNAQLEYKANTDSTWRRVPSARSGRNQFNQAYIQTYNNRNQYDDEYETSISFMELNPNNNNPTNNEILRFSGVGYEESGVFHGVNFIEFRYRINTLSTSSQPANPQVLPGFYDDGDYATHRLGSMTGILSFTSYDNRTLEYRLSNSTQWLIVPQVNKLVVKVERWGDLVYDITFSFLDIHSDVELGYTVNGAVLTGGGNEETDYYYGTSYIDLRYRLDRAEIEEPSEPELEGIRDGAVLNITVNVDALPTINQLKSGFRLLDEHDGDISETIIVGAGSTYTGNRELGLYTLIFEGRDSSNNVVSITIKINIEDTTNPMVELREELLFKLSDNVSLDDIKARLNYTDNFDIVSSLGVTFKNHNLEIPGESTITVVVSDLSGNRIERIFNINIVDDIAPVLLSSPGEPIRISYKIGLSIDYILDLFDIIDEHSSVEKSIVNNVLGYFYNKNKVGSYNETILAIDSSGNELSVPFIIEVFDSVPPLFVINETIFLLEGDRLTMIQLINTMRASGMVANNAEVRVLSDTYSDSSNGMGVIILKAGNEGIEFRFNITTLSENDQEEVIDNESLEAPIDELIRSHFNNFIEAIKNHFNEHKQVYIIVGCILGGLVLISIVSKIRKKK